MAELHRIITKDGVEMIVSGKYLETIKSFDLTPADLTKNGITAIGNILIRLMELENQIELLERSRENFFKSN